jgi:tol-pal system protein YbgF
MADLQNLINTLRTAPPPPPGSPASGDGVNPAAQVPAGPPAGVSAETLYTNGYRDYVGGKYDIGMQEFTDYLRYFPTTAFASNAQYYIGDIYYRRQDYANAQQAFDAVLERYADGNKTPDALYMKGQSLIGLGKNDAAAAEFRDVIRRFPDSDIAAKAKARLKEMGLSVGATSSKRRAH